MPKITRPLNKTSRVLTPETLAIEALTAEPSALEPLKVLITRPEIKAQQLALLLTKQGIENTSQPLFDYQPYASSQELSLALAQADIIIFVSVAAVNFANSTQPLTNSALKNSSSKQVFAVGNATKQALLDLNITPVLSPPPSQEHSEGLLQLSALHNVVHKNVLIIRGNGGREHIANTLRSRGAKVNYVEIYQRVWRTLSENMALHWQATQINCIVVTSNDILEALVEYFTRSTMVTKDYWQKKCLWVVVSERIESNAKTLGLVRVVNAQSANAQILCNTISYKEVLT